MQQTSHGKFDRLQRTTAGFTATRLDGYGLCCSSPTRPQVKASYPVLVHRHTLLLHASFRPRLATTPLRFANPSPPSGWIRDSHPQTVEHARHTMTVCGKHGKTIKPFSHPSHKPWKSLRDFHIPSALRLIIFTQFSNQKRSLPQLPNPRLFRLIFQLEKTEGKRISLVTMAGRCFLIIAQRNSRPSSNLDYSAFV